MSFHVIFRRPKKWGAQASVRRVSAKVYSNGNQRRAHLTISGDLVAHLHAQAGDHVAILIGFGEDQGDFAIERTTNVRVGRKLIFQKGARSAQVTLEALDFVPLTPGLVTVFDIELAEDRVICRAPQAAALPIAAE